MKLTINKAISLLAVIALAPTMALAERYLIKFESDQTFASYSMDVANQKSLMTTYSNGPVRTGVQFMNSDASVTDALDALKMVIVEVDGDIDLEMLNNHPSIQMIEKEVMIPAPEPVNTHGAYGTSSVISLSDFETPWGLEAVNAEAAWDLNGRGEGVKVLVLDTGVDRDHPALAINFVEGRNFTSDDSSEMPYDYFDSVGHGTHVAGTILGENVGVAPLAQLYAGKVCGNLGCPSFAIVAGVNWAIEMGADVVNMSLGGSFPSNRQVYEAAEEADVLIVAASGNSAEEEGYEANPKISYPAGHPTVFAVGAINQDFDRAGFSQWGKKLDLVAPGTEVLSSVPMGTGQVAEASVNLGKGVETIESLPMDGSAMTEETVSGEIVYAGLGKPEDFEELDVDGKIALIQRGEIAFGDKAKAAFSAGATGVIIFNNKEGLDRGTLNAEMTIPVVMIAQATGTEIMEATESQAVEGSVGVLASDYAELQGTSMATPHVAGVSALVRAANPELTAAEVRDILRNTTTELDGDNSENQLGTGLANAAQAVEAALESATEKLVVGM